MGAGKGRARRSQSATALQRADQQSTATTLRLWHGTAYADAIRENGFTEEKISGQGIFCAGVWTSEDQGGAYGAGNAILAVEYESRNPLVTYDDGYRGGGPSAPGTGALGFSEAQNSFIKQYQRRHGKTGQSRSLLFRAALLEEGYDTLVVHGNPVGETRTTFFCLLDVERIKVVS